MMLFLIGLSLLSSAAVYATNSINSTNSTNTTNTTNTNIIRRLLTIDSWHGGLGGNFYVMESSQSSAYITRICVRDGDVIDQIQVWFNTGETSGLYGGSGGQYSCYQVSNGNCITSANGREGALIDSLQFFSTDGSHSLYWGSNGGQYFREQGANCLNSLYVRAGIFIDGLQFNWQGPSHDEVCRRHGVVATYDGTISNVIIGQCAGVYLPGVQGTRLIMWECDGSQNQQWHYDPYECDTKGEIKNQEFNLCIGVYLQPDPVGTQLILWQCDGSQNQKWYYNPNTKEIQNVEFALCLGFADGHVDNHPDVVLQNCDGSNNQKNQIESRPI